MKNSPSARRAHSTSPLRALRLRSHPSETARAAGAEATRDIMVSQQVSSYRSPTAAQNARTILISLAFPSIMMVLTFSMFGVALPTIRDDFQVQADMAAWIVTVFTLPFMILMPFYGRLGDGLGKRRLILAGIAIFLVGTSITLLATDLRWLMLGRAIQGIGSAGIMPLGMAIITGVFPPQERGKALGTWSSIGPTVGFFAPLLAGFLIDHFGWRAIFGPPLVMGFIAFMVVLKKVPAGIGQARPNFLRSFDWGGVFLLGGGIMTLLFYLSSRPITGVEPLHDWRLLIVTIVLMAGFLIWEKHRQNPFISLNLFADKTFSLASICGGIRMFTMSGAGFLVPLYLADVHGLKASYLGAALMINAGAMIVTVRIGGQVADRWGSRWPVVIGLTAQTSAMLLFSQLPATTPLWIIAGFLAFHGLGAGLVLASLHRAAMGHASEAQAGMAAGLYSMIRFAGAVVGTALGGVILQNRLNQALPPIQAYQTVFLFFAGVAFLGVIIGFNLREEQK
jgi:EmrB/QacA subfamily drug resistance transporter